MWLDILMLLPHQDETTIHVEGEPLLGLLDSLLLRTLCLVPRISRTWKPRIWHGHWYIYIIIDFHVHYYFFFKKKTYRWVLSFFVLNLFYLKLVVRVARKCSGREPGSSHGSNGSSSSWTYDSLRIHMYARAINACRCSYIYIMDTNSTWHARAWYILALGLIKISYDWGMVYILLFCWRC